MIVIVVSTGIIVVQCGVAIVVKVIGWRVSVVLVVVFVSGGVLLGI